MPSEQRNDLPEHPIGTLVIVLVGGALLAIGFLGLYFGVFLKRGGIGP